MKKKITIIVAIILLVIALRYSYGGVMKYLQNKAMKKIPAPSVLVEPVKEKEIQLSFDAPGRVTSKYQVNVLARIAGYLQNSYFKEGDFVKAGQILFQIEPTEYENTSDVAKANVENIKSQLEYAEKQLVRASELVKKDYIAKAKYDEILAQRNALKAQLASYQATYNDTQRNYGYTLVKAPVDGKIGIITVTVGNYVTPSSGALTTINSTNPIYVTFPLNSADFNALSNADQNNNQHRKVELYFTDGTKYAFDGEQDFQDNKIEQSTGTVTLRATFNNPNDQLLHGEFVNIKLYANNKVMKPVIPQTAVQENQEGKFVYKIDDEGIPQLTYIKTGGQEGKDWIIIEGISKNDKIVTDGIQKVTPGKPITSVSKEEMNKIKSFEEHENNQDK